MTPKTNFLHSMSVTNKSKNVKDTNIMKKIPVSNQVTGKMEI